MCPTQSLVRNFCIIAHIDHGKSTLADRILEVTGAVDSRNKVTQILDRMDLERERGITIKASAVRLAYEAKDGQTYQLNLIDTPGHVDFSYEVSRSLAACEGALLVVDSSQGVEAQTVANVYLAVDQDLEVIPVINKIDLPGAEPDRTREEIENVIGLDATDALEVSAKVGTGVDELMEALVERLPPPEGDPELPLRALIFDSWYDSYRGVIALVRVVDGTVEAGDHVLMMGAEKEFEVHSLGVFSPTLTEVGVLVAGEVGFIAAGIKDIRDARVGDTVTGAGDPATSPVPGFRDAKPMVFSGLYPVDPADHASLRDSLEKLRLNDASFTFEPETSAALGFGFRCGFLGLLHMEIVQERLEREYDLDLITTAPSVVYHCTLKNGETIEVDNPARIPDLGDLESISEPYIETTIHVPSEHVGAVLGLCFERRGIQQDLNCVGPNRTVLRYLLPLAEVAFDFYDRLKTVSRGYASMDYSFHDYRVSDLVRLDILVNGEPVDALCMVSHQEKAFYRGRELASRLKKLIPRQLFEVAIQAAIGTRVVSRTNVRALRKDVTAKCYGGDVTRKRKLLDRQRAGKKRMKQVGNVEIPQQAFMAILRVDES